MTDKQLEQKRKELQEEMNAKGFGWINGSYVEPPQEYKIKEKELGCINMINSILAYDWHNDTAEEIMQKQEKAYKNYLSPYIAVLGRAKVLDLIQEQINSIVRINRNVATDSEGCSYNSIVWNE